MKKLYKYSTLVLLILTSLLVCSSGDNEEKGGDKVKESSEDSDELPTYQKQINLIREYRERSSCMSDKDCQEVSIRIICTCVGLCGRRYTAMSKILVEEFNRKKNILENCECYLKKEQCDLDDCRDDCRGGTIDCLARCLPPEPGYTPPPIRCIAGMCSGGGY